MTGMFPDSGVPYTDAKNSLSDPNTQDCNELWYSTSRCAPRFDAAASNAVLSEMLNLVNAGEVVYDCDLLDNVQLAVRYIVQRGIPEGTPLTGGPNNFSGMLSPPATRYNDFQMVRVVPNINVLGGSTLSMNGLAFLPILRNDGVPIKTDDLLQGKPALLMHYQGFWYVPGMVKSQLPQVVGPNMILYVNSITGDDVLYDGTKATVSGSNGPFKTIQRAIDETFKYGPSVYAMNISVAAGTYNEACNTPNVRGPTMIITGAGKQQTFVTGANDKHTFNIFAANTVIIQNLHVATGTGVGPPCCFSAAGGASLYTLNTASSFCAWAIWEAYTGYVFPGTHDFDAGSATLHVYASFFNSFVGFQQNIILTFAGTLTMGAGGAFVAASSGGSVSVPFPWQPTFVNPGFVVGQRYNSTVNAVINTQGLGATYFPGTVAGATSIGGQYV